MERVEAYRDAIPFQIRPLEPVQKSHSAHDAWSAIPARIPVDLRLNAGGMIE